MAATASLAQAFLRVIPHPSLTGISIAPCTIDSGVRREATAGNWASVMEFLRSRKPAAVRCGYWRSGIDSWADVQPVASFPAPRGSSTKITHAGITTMVKRTCYLQARKRKVTRRAVPGKNAFTGDRP